MLKQIYLELIRSGVNPRHYTLANDVGDFCGIGIYADWIY